MATDGEGWVHCACGERHWGRYGAAGLLLADRQPPAQVVLQHRALWSHQGGTWGIPGGARDSTESALAAALREAGEEAGLDPDQVRPHAQLDLEHPDWSYSTILAFARGEEAIPVGASDAESIAVQWHPVSDLDHLPLLPAFESAWPQLEQILHLAPVLVIDAANVVGSRPDGWWRDRRGAATRLVAQLATWADHGVRADLLHLHHLPATRWWPRVLVITEGAARGVPAQGPVEVIEAGASGDDAIVAAVQDLHQRGPAGVHPVISVVTADRGLRERISALGAQFLGPGTLWRMIDAGLRPSGR